MIPKKIHYCWFGGKEKPELVKKCIASWKKHLPDYELVEWNEDNFDINCNTFVSQAYENRNFAFVSDYVRAKKLFEYGGIYLDTDVEGLKSFDRFLEDECFVGFEEKQFVGTCVIGAVPGTDILRSYTEHYESIPFIQPDGSKYKDTNVVLLTGLLEKYGLVRNDEKQTVHGVTVYPRTFFSPYDYINGINYITDDSYAIHHFAQLWLPAGERIRTALKRKVIKIIGGNAWAKLRGR